MLWLIYVALGILFWMGAIEGAEKPPVEFNHPTQYNTLTTPSGLITVLSPAPTTISFQGGLELHSDGTVTASPDVKPDEAARKVLEAFKQIAPQFFKQNCTNVK